MYALLKSKEMDVSNLNNKEIMSNNIKRYLNKLNINSKKLSEDINTPYTTVRSWIQKENYPRIEKIEQMANYFNISKSDLVEDETFSHENIPITSSKRLPIIDSVAYGTSVFDEDNIQDYFLSGDIIDADFCCYAKGDSMIEANINDGDLIFAHRTSNVDNGKIAVVLIGEKISIRRVYKTDDNLVLQAENKSYQPLLYKEADCQSENVIVIGEMAGVYKIIKQ